jgi:hypothetical protein
MAPVVTIAYATPWSGPVTALMPVPDGMAQASSRWPVTMSIVNRPSPLPDAVPAR